MCSKGVCVDPVLQFPSTFKSRSALSPSVRSIPCSRGDRPACAAPFVNQEGR